MNWYLWITILAFSTTASDSNTHWGNGGVSVSQQQMQMDTLALCKAAQDQAEARIKSMNKYRGMNVTVVSECLPTRSGAN